MAIKDMFFDAEQSGGVYDREYSASDFSKYLEKIVGNGVFPTPSTQLQARAGSGLQVIVAPGHAWIDGHKLINTADLPLTIDAADSVFTRIDAVVVYCDYTNREMGVSVIKGTPAAAPVAPSPERTSDRYELVVAWVYVRKNVTTLSNTDITDTRADSNICGWVSGLIQQLDTTTLFQQWDAAYNAYYTSTKQQLDDFMETLTQELNVNTFVKEYVQDYGPVDSSGSSFTFEFDPTGYTFYATDIFKVYSNGILLTPGKAYKLTTPHDDPQILKPKIELRNRTSLGFMDLRVVVTKSVIGIENM
jgi:hypothetical protein